MILFLNPVSQSNKQTQLISGFRENNHTIYLQYANINTTQPSGPTDLESLINLIKSWINATLTNDITVTTGSEFHLVETRVATTLNIFNAQFRYDNQPLLFTSLNTAGGTTAWTTNSSCVTIATSTGATNYAIFQTKEYMPYQADCNLFVTIGAIKYVLMLHKLITQHVLVISMMLQIKMRVLILVDVVYSIN